MSASKLDAVYRSILLTKFFTKGWGKPENLRRLFEFRKVVSNREQCYKLVEKDYPVTITKEQQLADCKLLEGYFMTPLERYLPGIVPEIAQKAHFQAILPVHWPEKGVKPMCLHLAGTGDHYFWRRRNLMVKPLLKEAGIGGIILENPFYGLRKPEDQIRSSLHNVSDIFVMGGCLILEALVLFHWCERNGLGPLGVTGLSMGGHMASLAATNWPKPLVLVPCLSWSTASAVFLQGVMSQSINWDLLEDQYMSDGVYREKLSKMVTIIDESFLAGKKFARTYSETMVTNPEIPTKKENVDITYKEVKSNVIDVSRSLEMTQDPKNKPLDSYKLEDLQGELNKLLEENKISQLLYDKLTSNEKFVLDPEDIDDINKLSEERIKEILLKVKVATVKNEDFSELLIQANKIAQKESIKVETVLTKNEGTYEKPVLKGDSSKISVLKTSKSEPDQQSILKCAEIREEKKNIVKSTKDNQFTVQSTKDKSLVQSTNNNSIVQNNNDISLVQSAQDNNFIIPSAKDTFIVQSTEDNKFIVQSTKDTIVESKEDKYVVQSTKSSKVTVQSTKDKKSLVKSPKDKSSWSSDWNLPFWKSSGKKIDINKIHWRDREALQFMRGVMDECTHLSNFSVPFDTSLIIAVCAKHDAYVPRDDVGTLEEIWPGAEVRYVDAGHVSAYILHQSMFRGCIREAFERSKKKWKDGKHID